MNFLLLWPTNESSPIFESYVMSFGLSEKYDVSWKEKIEIA